MIKKIPGETWKPLEFPGWKQLRKKYALSSMGRVASYSKDVASDGKLLNGSLTTGYKTLNLHRPGNNGTLSGTRRRRSCSARRSGPRRPVPGGPRSTALDLCADQNQSRRTRAHRAGACGGRRAALAKDGTRL